MIWHMRTACLFPGPILALLAAGQGGDALVAQDWVLVHGPEMSRSGGAFDMRRQRAVILGSEGEVWEYEGTRRLHRAVASSSPRPAARSYPMMAYEERRDRVLLFGGQGPTGDLNDTWAWDGGRWQALSSPVSPSPRSRGAIAYDAVRDRVVLFGGWHSTQLYDTWEHDGTQWLQRTPTTVPPLSFDHPMAFDRTIGAAVMAVMHQAPFPNTGLLPTEVWQWNGTNWLLRPASGSAPLSRAGASLIHDAGRQRTVLVGGLAGEIWEWDGTAWTSAGNQLTFARTNAVTWFDPSLAAAVVYGGLRQNYAPDTSVWTWDGTQAALRLDETRPEQRSNYAFCFDSQRGDAVLFGGNISVSGIDDDSTWTFRNRSWTKQNPLIRPPARTFTTATYDAIRGVGLVFGGQRNNSLLGDLWEWNGSAWQPLPQTSGPPVRRLAGMAFDIARDRMVLFGGIGPNNTLLADTWEWDGTAWSSPQPPAAPSGGWVALAYDSTRARTVSFGGSGLETWEWDGSVWQQRVTATFPGATGPISQLSMTYDPAAQKSVLTCNVGSGLENRELWFYDGLSWTLASHQFAPNGYVRIAYDDHRQRVLVHESNFVREWSTTIADTAEFGIGCGSPVPRLALRTRARTGDADFGLEVLAGPSNICGIAVSTNLMTTPIGGGCAIEIGPALASFLLFANGSGLAVLPIVLPPSPAFLGITLFAQAGAVDPFTGSLALTAGRSFTIGD